MGFKADGVVVAVFAESAKLADPVDDAGADGLPFEFAAGLTGDILCVAMADAVFGNEVVAGGKRCFGGEGSGVAGIPVEHEVSVGDGFQDSS